MMMMTEPATALRVLVVDDESLIRWSVAETLADAGHLVREAGNAREAAQALSEGWMPDVVLLDFRLPDSDDLSLLRRIRGQVPGSAIVMMTAYGAPEMIAEATSIGVEQVMSKPLDMSEILTVVHASHAARTARGLGRH